MAYTIEISPGAQKQIRRLDPQYRGQIYNDIRLLQEDPRRPGVIKLRDATNLYRLRSGNYRILFEIHDGRLFVIVVAVADRKDAY